MLNTRIGLRRMLAQSGDVLAHPQPRIFYNYSARGSDSDALTYVAIAAVLITVFELLIAGGGSAIGLVLSVINELFGFYLFAGVIYFVAQQQNGRGTFQELAYTFSLFYVPIQVIVAALTWLVLLTPLAGVLLPWFLVIRLAGFVAQAFYAQRAVKGVMGFRGNKEAWIAVGVGLVLLWVIQMVFAQMSSI
jgi:hypothetical protein